MNLPLWNDDSDAVERLRPCGDVLVDTVDERAVQVEQETWQIGTLSAASRLLVLHLITSSDRSSAKVAEADLRGESCSGTPVSRSSVSHCDERGLR